VRYYEKDEARHVGLGVQHLPDLMRRATRLQNARAIWFQIKMSAWTIRGLQILEPHFNAIGVPTRRVIKLGRGKMFTASEMLWSGMGMERPMSRQRIEAAIDAVMEVLFPRPEIGSGMRSRLAAAHAVWKAGGYEHDLMELDGG
jgi:hypothetical protein